MTHTQATAAAAVDVVPDTPALKQGLQWLMGARLLVAGVLLGGTLALTFDAKTGFTAFTPSMLLSLAGATFFASVLFASWALWGKRIEVLAVVQFAWDALLVTGLVYITGAAGSVLSMLYGIVILMAALLLGARASYLTALGCGGLYLVVGVAVANGWIDAPPDQPSRQYSLETPELGFAVLSNMLGLALVAGLAGSLAGRLRQTGGALRRAAESAATLARLNDDIVRSLSSGLLTTDLAGEIQTANAAAGDILTSTTTALQGRPLIDFLPVHVTVPDAPRRGEGEAQRATGEAFPVGFTANPLVGTDGAITGTVVSFQDLTDIRLLERNAERAERLAVLGRLAAGLAHEIRNPLSSISGSVQLVREANALGDEDRHLLGIVLSEVERLDELVSTMLFVGRPQEPNRSPVDVSLVAAEVVAMAEQGPGARHEVHIELETVEGAVICLGDPDQLRQVVWNLLKNAVQATPAGGAVHLSVRSADDGDAVIEVADDGAGVDEESSDRLFDMFTSGREHGVGLGLALVKQIVDGHGGTVTARNGPSGGAVFCVTVPGRRPVQ